MLINFKRKGGRRLINLKSWLEGSMFKALSRLSYWFLIVNVRWLALARCAYESRREKKKKKHEIEDQGTDQRWWEPTLTGINEWTRLCKWLFESFENDPTNCLFFHLDSGFDRRMMTTQKKKRKEFGWNFSQGSL